MTCKLVIDNNPTIIPMSELPYGKLGVIVDGSEYDGEIVIKVSNTTYKVLGQEYTNSFNILSQRKVRILEEGELIEVKYS